MNQQLGRVIFLRGWVSVLMMLFVCGCAEMSDATRTKTEAAVTGAAAGAIIGQLAGGSKESTALGALIGGAIGGAIGTQTGDQKARYAQIEAQLKEVIASAVQSTQEAHKANQQLAKEILQLKRRQDSLIAQGNLGAAKKRALLADKQKTEKLIEKTGRDVAAIEQKLASQRKFLEAQQQLAATQKTPDNSNLITVALTKINNLETERGVMVASLDQLRQIDQRRAY